MTDVYTPAARAFVAAGLLLATATLMFVAVTTARAAAAPVAFGERYYSSRNEARSLCDRDNGAIRTFVCSAKG